MKENSPWRWILVTRQRTSGNGQWRAWLVTYTTLWALTLAVAIVVCITPDAPALTRELLHLKLNADANPQPSIGVILSIAANNALHSTWPLTLGLLDAQRRRFTRTIADALALTNLLVPALLAGGALAGYGLRALPYLPHVPVEWAGIATGTTGWLIERHTPLTPRERTTWIALTIALLTCAASIETYLVPHR
jgi:hypothetical protein